VRKEHPWLYAESLRSVGRGASSGDVAVIYDRKGELLALGLYDPDSPIRVRVLHRGGPRPIDAAFFAERLRAAHCARSYAQGTTGYRVVNGENDGPRRGGRPLRGTLC
jgi:23S rRNA (cytosine1962-C5)-methyltransferase